MFKVMESIVLTRFCKHNFQTECQTFCVVLCSL